MVDNELELSLNDLQAGDVIEQQVGFECGGNSQRLLYGLIGNANWRGTTLSSILNRAGIKEGAKRDCILLKIYQQRKYVGEKWKKLLREVYQLMTQCVRRICFLRDEWRAIASLSR